MKPSSVFLSASTLIAFASSAPAFANRELVPPPFEVKSGQAVFVDFQTVHYDVAFDYRAKVATVVSTIAFEAYEAGHPVFDLLAAPKSVVLDGAETTQALVKTPGGETSLRVLDQAVEPGPHRMVITSRLSTKVDWGWSGVTSFFSIRDLSDRKFIEQYVPTNLEFDQAPITIEVHFQHMRAPNQEFFTNGKVTELARDHYLVEYPEYFTASSPFFHTAPRGKFRKRVYGFPSISGAIIPIVTYKNFFIYNLRKFERKAKAVITELERDYGAFGHSSVHIFAKGLSGGMEHSGATETSYRSLGHELFHSYFAKGVMPANGNAGWIDEAFASWRDRGYPRLNDPAFAMSNMGGKSPYQRATDTRAYTQGMRFMAYMDYKLAQAGTPGLKQFMREFYGNYLHRLITVGTLQAELEKYSGLDLQEDFDRYVLGKYGPGAPDSAKPPADEDEESKRLHSGGVH